MTTTMTLQALTAGLQAAELRGDGKRVFQGVSTDSRTCARGELFFALSGDRFDGHDFAAVALAAGAAALVVERWLDIDCPQIKVVNARQALGQLAANWRRGFDIPLIAVAGSNGKTTVTQMIASILQAAYAAEHRLATRGNLNNDIGLPLMLCQLASAHRAAVVELGMNHPGEMAYLAGIAQANIAVITNAQREHQEFMHSVEATAYENGAVIEALPGDGVAVFPGDDAFCGIWRAMAEGRTVMDFGFEPTAQVFGRYQLSETGARVAADTPQGALDFQLPIAGVHNVRNALAAIAATLAAGVDKAAIVAGLETFAPLAGRGVRWRISTGACLIDESYNANPDSVLAAIDTLALQRGVRTLVLGDMGETGDEDLAFHAEVGRYARERGIDQLLAIGESSLAAVTAFNALGQANGWHFSQPEALIAAARRAVARADASLLVKGSRFMRMERVIQALRAEA